jgi:hypothetical protein
VVPVLIAAGVCLPFLARLFVAMTPAPAQPQHDDDPWPATTTTNVDDVLGSAVCILHNVRVTGAIPLDEEILVAFWGCGGTWFAPDDRRANRLGIVRDPGWLEGNMAFSLPWPFARHRAIDTFAKWQRHGTPLTAFVSVQHELVGLVDLATGTLFASELPAEWLGRAPASTGK